MRFRIIGTVWGCVLFCLIPSFAVAAEKIEFSGDIRLGREYTDIDYDTHSFWRLRLAPTLKPLEHLALRSRIGMRRSAKASGYDTDDFYVERFFIDWNKIGDMPINLAAGRLATMENFPTQFRFGLDEADGELSPYTNLVLDGVRAGVDYSLGAGGIKLLYAKVNDEWYDDSWDESRYLEDSTFYGLGLRLFRNESNLLSLHSLLVKDIYNVPDDVLFINPIEYYIWRNDPTYYDPSVPSRNLILDRENLGDIYITSLEGGKKIKEFDFFVVAGWSHTNAKAFDEMGTSLLGSWWDEPEDRDGYSIYLGGRYHMPQIASSIGLEFNYGSKYWISLDQDGENSKLATRGKVVELYWIYTPPMPNSIGDFAQHHLRLGYEHFWFDYTGSGSYLGEPQDIEDLLNDPLNIQFYTQKDTSYRFYLAYDLFF